MSGPKSSAYMRTEFLERLAHELRGPVGVTSGALDEIELALGPAAEPLRVYFLMARRGMGRVLREADRLQRTALLEGGAIEWAKMPIDLRTVAAEAATNVELLEARRGIRVDVSCSEEACLVVADPDWMRAAIAEVVGNAIRFARSVVSVHTARSPTEGMVTVIDDGAGFTAPLQRRFEPTAQQRGIGLSLPLVCDVLAAHGGRIDIAGSGASGGQVVLALPIAPGGAERPGPSEAGGAT